MATPSPEPQKSWQRLTTSARDAAAPVDLDVRVAVRAQIGAVQSRIAEESNTNVLDEIWTLFSRRWFDVPIALLIAATFFMCWEGLIVVKELSFVWQLQGPVLSGI